MSKKKYHYKWVIGEPPPIIGEHSLTKHGILEAYLIHYLEIATQNLNVTNLPIYIVDGFSGGGLYSYNDGTVSGSPLLMLDAVQAAQSKINMSREQNKIKKQLKIQPHFYFVEKEKDTFNFLKQTLHNRGYNPGNYTLIHGEFNTKCRYIVRDIKRRRVNRCIFLLDQYGYSEVALQNIAYIAQELEKSEIFLTFAVDTLIDYLTDKKNLGQTLLRKIGINEKKDIRIIMDSLGDKETPQWRKSIQYNLHDVLHKSSHYHYYTPFFIKSQKSHRAYWLLHFSHHLRARSAIMEIHWKYKSDGPCFEHYGSSGFNMLGYDVHPGDARQQSLFSFTEEDEKRVIETLQNDLLRRINNQREISFEKLYSQDCNHTPATLDLFKKSLQHSLNRKDIEIYSKDNKRRRKANRIENSDIIKAPLQMRFFFRYP